jgi:hypothetical protein
VFIGLHTICNVEAEMLYIWSIFLLGVFSLSMKGKKGFTPTMPTTVATKENKEVMEVAMAKHGGSHCGKVKEGSEK